MGSGKSTLGKKIAKKLNLTFLDLDQLIEEQEHDSIAHIFNTKGENYFRGIETAVLNDSIDSNDSFVMSLGGGTPCFNNNLEVINKTGKSIYLKYNTGVLISRLVVAKQQRPLLINKTDEELKKFVVDLLAKRELFYNQSHVIIEGKNITIKQIIENI